MNKTLSFSNEGVCARQIAFFAAFLLPVYKLLELPSILARFMQGDLLIPALLHYLLQAGVLTAVLIAASRSETPLIERLQKRLGKWIYALFAVYAAYFLFSVALPLLDLEKFIYAAFYDTSPTIFSFTTFFILSAFVCAKGFKTTGRIADLSLFLFLLPFFALLLMSVMEADASSLLPLFEKELGHTLSAFTYTTPHFSDVILLLPLLFQLRYKKGDAAKIAIGYSAGALFTLLFLGVFYGLYSTIAAREHYAFSKIAQYFPVLSVIGRIDLVFVYMLSIVLFFYTCIPMQYAVDFLSRLFPQPRKTWCSAAVNIGAFFFVLFCNKYYNAFYAFFGNVAPPIFWLLADLSPLALLFFRKEKTEKKEKPHA